MATRYNSDGRRLSPTKRSAGVHRFGAVITDETLQVGVNPTALAATGTTTADAAVVSIKYTVTKVTGADTTKGVRLPAAPAGTRITIVNFDNAVLKIYPPTGGNFNNGSTDAIYTNSLSGSTAKSAASFVYLTTTTVFGMA